MAKINYHIRTLNNYKDWYDKAIYDFVRYKETSGVYKLADCFLTLNALPEWIIESTEASEKLKKIAKEKVEVMKGQNGFVFDENRLNEIDHKLRFIRIFCNYSKHAGPKDKFPKIEMSATLPATLPIKFENISIGNSYFKAGGILSDVISFWSGHIDTSK